MTRARLTANQERLRRTAYREAAALLAADMDDADLQCDQTYAEEDASWVREFIREEIVLELERKGRES